MGFCLLRHISDLSIKTCCRSLLLAPLGSAKGFPSPVSIPTLMVLQEKNFPQL